MLQKFNKNKISIIFLLVLILVLLHFINLLQPVESWVMTQTNTVSSQLYTWTNDWKTKYFSQKQEQDFRQENKNLRKKVNKLTAENAKLRKLKEENKKLKQLLDFRDEYNYKQLPAKIISKVNFLSSNNPTLLIDKGKKHGIEPNLAVVNPQGLLVGKVKEVKENTSKIYLTTHTEVKVAGSLLKESSTSGITKGQLGLTINMDFIPQTSDIQTEDLVVTSGLEKNIPSGLVIGRVNKVTSKSNEVWKTASIEPLTDMKNLSLVSVILPN